MRRLNQFSVRLGLSVVAVIFTSLLGTPLAYASGWAATNLTTGNSMSGQTWTPVAVSGGSKYVVAYNYGSGIKISSDHGAHWSTPSGAAQITGLSLLGLTISYTGKYVATAAQNGDIWISSDYGTNWTNRTAGSSLSGLNWQAVTSSASGQYLVASAFSDGLYRSSDYRWF